MILEKKGQAERARIDIALKEEKELLVFFFFLFFFPFPFHSLTSPFPSPFPSLPSPFSSPLSSLSQEMNLIHERQQKELEIQQEQLTPEYLTLRHHQLVFFFFFFSSSSSFSFSSFSFSFSSSFISYPLPRSAKPLETPPKSILEKGFFSLSLFPPLSLPLFLTPFFFLPPFSSLYSLFFFFLVFLI